ncbi:MAG: PAS domain S-box protein, partial [Chloroflexota bacterium]
MKERGNRPQGNITSEEAIALYETLANSSPIGVYIVQDGKFRFLNPQFLKYTGYSEDELLHMHSSALVYPEDREKARQDAVDMLKGRRLSPYEFRFIAKWGEVRWAMETSTSITYGEKRATLANFMDITERRRVESSLRASENKYRTLVENLPQKIFLKDRNLAYVSCNVNYGRDLRIQPEEISGKTDYDFYPRELADKYRADDRRIIESG